MQAEAFVCDAKLLYLTESKKVISFFFAISSDLISFTLKLKLYFSFGNKSLNFIFFFFKKNTRSHLIN